MWICLSLEGLQVYQIPVICSEYIKEDVEKPNTNRFYFIELDLVQVKGKPGQKISLS